MQALVRLQNVAHRCYPRPITRPVARVIEIAIRLVFQCYLPAAARVHPTVHFHHNGLAVLVNRLAEIGPGCQIGPQVVLGGRSPVKGAPCLHENVIVHSGAKLIGPITIGAGAVIGANAVVLCDVPAGATAVGVPARIIERPDRGAEAAAG